MRTINFGLLSAVVLAWGCGVPPGPDEASSPAPIQPGPLQEPCMSAPEPEPMDPGARTRIAAMRRRIPARWLRRPIEVAAAADVATSRTRHGEGEGEA